ncbi:metallophosphoesterase [Vibrio sp. SCSIO 43135]|uniref:metallophosphoesterase family protein n=1 Tax=Vibrio sp. SCSIO 43135 TaxID=2819096 RepID=UPI0020751CC0|nr:metallophosphoesterase [Vibrio sp. SCSIO 43135]USD41246.1 metallophosphoesterase [Vibrio sp. SCSIO 43135]
MLRLIHFSDIHLRSPDCDFDHTDENIHIRDMVQRDIAEFTSADGKAVDAVLITGDIAFAGKESEYQAAHRWLDNLKEALKLSNDQIFVVPGNHDVDRNRADELLPRMMRDNIESKTQGWEREKTISEAFRSEHADAAFFAPMQKYVDFSSHYGCQITPSRPFWSKSLKLSESVNVELRGITTPFFSNKNDSRGSLILSKSQLNFRKLPGVVHISLMHHPCDWLVDSDEIEDILDNNVHIQLFGHKHRSRWSNADNLLKVESISLHPDRYESSYEPGYNIIDLSQTQSSDKKCTITAKVVVRKLESNPQMFVSKPFFEHKGYFTKAITLDVLEPKSRPKAEYSSDSLEAPTLETGGDSQSTRVDEKTTDKDCNSAKQSNINIKEASRVFGLLERSSKDKILLECALLDQDELLVSDVEKQQIAFQRAIEQGKESQLYKMIMMKGKAI